MESIARGKPQVDGVAEALPLLVGKEIAEFTKAVCNSLVGAHCLGVVYIFWCPFKVICH